MEPRTHLDSKILHLAERSQIPSIFSTGGKNQQLIDRERQAAAALEKGWRRIHRRERRWSRGPVAKASTEKGLNLPLRQQFDANDHRVRPLRNKTGKR
jgi:hypothetical protein